MDTTPSITMEENTTDLSQHGDLTGQTSIVDHVAKFTGNYSSVYLGSFNGNSVAIKVIKATGKYDSVKRKVLREVTVWGATNHPNVYPFYGFANDEAFGPFGALVSPWCSNGDATRFLQENGGRMIVADRINLWNGVIDGLVYLHGLKQLIVHGDLKPGNILIDDLGKPRICDFGLARIFLDEPGSGLTTTSEHTGTTRYLAPELVDSEVTVYPTLASDVYALGCLGLEFIYLQKPFANHPNNLRGRIIRDIREGLPPAAMMPRQAWPSHRAWSILETCWNADPRRRSSALTTSASLRRIAFTLPFVVTQRVIHHVGLYTELPGSSTSDWAERSGRLRNLCLVSKAFRAATIPILYRRVHLFLSHTIIPLHALVYAINDSMTRPNPINQLYEGYGSYIEIIVLSVSGSRNYGDSITSSIQTILPMMSKLRLLLIHEETVIPNVRSGPLTALHLLYIPLSFLLAQDTILQLSSCLQQLYIILSAGPSENVSTPSNLFLPNLQEIEICDGGLGDGDGRSQVLEKASTWIMPRLMTLHLWSREDREENSSSIIRFLRSYGPQLHYLTLDLTSTSRAPTWYVGRTPRLPILKLLRLCITLRSLIIDAWSIPALDLTPHSHLETISILRADESPSWFRDPQPGQDPSSYLLQRFHTFKAEAPNLFSKLVRAKLHWKDERDSEFAASFRTGDNNITLKSNRPIGAYY